MRTVFGGTATGEVPRISAGLMKFFAPYSRRYVRRHFHASRILQSGLPRGFLARPLVIYLNHASWWDPLVCLLLAGEFFRNRASFAPIDAAMLERYGFFKKLGFFGVEPRTHRGALEFLRTSNAILSDSQNLLWVTPQGRFTDVRERPLRLEKGIGRLAVLLPDVVFLPLAIEYAFWTERCPEVLVSFGEPCIPGEGRRRDAREWTGVFERALGTAQDEVAAASCRRNPSEWRVLDRGASGVTAGYDWWKWLLGRARGERFSTEHQAEVES